ncbi:MAG: ferritin [Methanoculleus sp. SDB]|nr:MAG: ferritin [Methanoculleus sp. SDB]
MMNAKVEKEINVQIRWELYSAYLYLSMSSWYESIGLRGFANWERIQAQEELAHAMKFFDYVISRGGRVILQPVDAPAADWTSPTKAFEQSLEHERFVTQRINDLVNLSLKEKDHASYNMLQWFIDEQIEEEANATEILEKLRMIENGGGSGMLYMLDKELATRVFTPPAPVKGTP